MNEQEAIQRHVDECRHRIDVISGFVNNKADINTESKRDCAKNIKVLQSVISALEEVQKYRAIGTVEECTQLKRDLDRQIEHSEHLATILKSTKNLLEKRAAVLKQYAAIGTVEECRVAVEKQRAKKAPKG